MNVNLYIQDSCALAPGISINSHEVIDKIPVQDGVCLMPAIDFSNHLDKTSLRRMTPMSQWALYVAGRVLENKEQIDCVYTATGFGCLKETDKFLKQTMEVDHDILSPTPFIQSTHNMIGGLIAQKYQFNCPNYTFSNRNISIENSLLHFYCSEHHRAVVTAFDEVSEFSHKSIQLTYPLNKKDLFLSDGIQNKNGLIMGEMAMSMVVSKDAQHANNLVIKALVVHEHIQPQLIDLIKINSSFESLFRDYSIGAVLLGENGVAANHKLYHFFKKNYFNSLPVVNFKAYTGESYVSTGAAIHIGCEILNGNWSTDNLKDSTPKNILIYNFIEHTHSIIVIGRQ